MVRTRYRVIYRDRGVKYIQSDNLKYLWLAKLVAKYWNLQYRMSPYEIETYHI